MSLKSVIGPGPEDEPSAPDLMSSASGASVQKALQFMEQIGRPNPNHDDDERNLLGNGTQFHPEQQDYVEEPHFEERQARNGKAVVICLVFVATCAVVCGIVGLLIGIVYNTTGILVGLGIGLAAGALVGLLFYVFFQGIGGRILEYCKAKYHHYDPVQ